MSIEIKDAAVASFEIKDAAGTSIDGALLVDGMRINSFGKPPELTASIVRNIKHLNIRDDDVMLCTPVKSGSHWAFEILSMLLGNKAEISPIHKLFLMLVNCTEKDLEKFASPRILNTHFPYDMLPEQLKEKKTKIVVVLRNPKDVAVSLFYHHKGINMFNYNGKFLDHLQLFKTGNVEYNSWFDYVLEMEKAAAAEPDRIRIFYYEDLKENGPAEIQKLAAFLHLSAANNEQLCREINEKCHINNLKKDKQMDPAMRKQIFKDDYSFFRKGEIGDWKSHFTVEESEAFDKLYAEKMKHSALKFRYEPSGDKFS